MRFLIRVLPQESGEFLLDQMKAVANSFAVDIRNPKRTSYGAYEVDVFTSNRVALKTFLVAIGPLCRVEFVVDLGAPSPTESTEQLILRVRSLFNHERYWEAHEALEGRWRVTTGSEKTLLQGIILVCAGYVHDQKGNDKVSLGVLTRALPKLDWAADTYYGIDIGSLRRNVEAVLASGLITFFKI